MDRFIWLSEQIDLASSASTQDELVNSLVNAAKALGFEHFAFGLRKSYPISDPETEMVNNYPEVWQLKYAQNGYLMSDPTVHHGLNSIMPIVWDEDVFQSARPLWEDARSYGLNHGWAQACRDSEGNIGMLSLVRSEDSLTESELKHVTPFLSWLAQLAHVGFSRYMLTIDELPPLTEREKEVLRWTAAGKTSWEISVILSVSKRTVDFHIKNSMNKLQVMNKTAAVVKAVLKGLI